MSTVQKILRPESITRAPIRPTDANIGKIPGILSGYKKITGCRFQI